MAKKTKQHSDDLPVLAVRAGLLPCVVGADGSDRQIGPADLADIEGYCSIGAAPNYIAARLGLTTEVFLKLCEQCEPVRQAVERGRAIDEYEMTQVVREQGRGGNVAAAIWYQKNKHSWTDNDKSQKGQGVAKIIVNTGIERENRVIIDMDNDAT